jgi:PBP1b-binding outer membrane lipoprotein LpoB
MKIHICICILALLLASCQPDAPATRTPDARTDPPQDAPTLPRITLPLGTDSERHHPEDPTLKLNPLVPQQLPPLVPRNERQPRPGQPADAEQM